VSLSLLAIALLAVGAGTQGRGPFTMLPPAEGVLALQLFLGVVAIPLLCLAGIIEERRRAQVALEERLSFEELLSRLSGAFVHLPRTETDRAFDTWLARMGEFFHVDRLTLVRFDPDGSTPVRSHAWTGPGGREGDGAPGSDIAIPLVAAGHTLGRLSLAAPAADRTSPGPLMPRFRLVAEVFANALAREQAEDALRASEAMKAGILASLPSHVAVLDRHGRIIAVNESWTLFAREHGAPAGSDGGVGTSYLELCRRAAREGRPHAADAAAGIQAVLDRVRADFALEYALGAGPRQRWFSMSVVSMSRPEGGAVVSHTDVTERKRAEVEAQRSRQELAHFTRVSTVGELAASLAHELSQPLTGILTNAQAARRYLDATPPDLAELQAILADIVDDDRRASEVIQRLRELLRKEDPPPALLDLNRLVRDVVKLLGSDALIRGMSVALELDPRAPVVSGDRVQLQQVILNLLLNAMDAMAENPVGGRTVVVRTEHTDVQTVHLSVRDAGTGLRPGTEELVFEPFYTTKPAGMGMGLAIARSIVEGHGGLTWATNNRGRGATFHVALPLTGEGPR
jgi:signal transduction histidine kinase